MKGKRFRSKELALKNLASRGEIRLPIDVFQLCKEQGILLTVCELSEDIPGVSFVYEGMPLIFVREKEDGKHQRFICAHEMGHLLQGHVGEWGAVASKTELERKEKEREAMVYAAELLIPQCLLLMIDAISIEKIMKLCEVPYRVAFYALKELEYRQAETIELTVVEAQIAEIFRGALKHKKLDKM